MIKIMSQSIKLYIRSCMRQGLITEKQELKKHLDAAECNAFKIIDSVSDADMIILTDIDYRNPYHAIIKQNDLIPYWKKIVCFSEADQPPVLVRGIYVSSLTGNHRSFPGLYVEFLRKINSLYVCNPLKESEKDILFSFMGRACNSLRKNLLKNSIYYKSKGGYVEDTTDTFTVFNIKKNKNEVAQREKYLDLLSRSIFVLCPKGAGPNSIRTYEAMRAGAIPVIISDKLEMPKIDGVGNYYMRVRENDLDKIPDILRTSLSEMQTYQQNVASAWRYFESEKFWQDSIKKLYSMVSQGKVKNSPLYIIYVSSLIKEFVRLPLKMRYAYMKSRNR